MIKLIGKREMEETTEKARRSPRLRMNFNYHELPDPVQRMLNAIEPGSYIRPHRHLNPPKVEVFIVLRGKGAVMIFDDAGNVTESFLLEAGGEITGIEVPPGQWHSIVSLEKGTVFFEVKDGPYVALTDKDFAPFAPAPEDPAHRDYLKKLEEKICG